MPIHRRFWTDEEIETVRSMRAAGKPLYLISAKLGRSKRAIQQRINVLRGEAADAETDA